MAEEVSAPSIAPSSGPGFSVSESPTTDQVPHINNSDTNELRPARSVPSDSARGLDGITIAMVFPYSVRRITGIGAVAQGISRSVEARGGSTSWFVPQSSGSLAVHPSGSSKLFEVPVPELPHLRNVFLALGTTARLIAGRPRPDIVHCHTPHLQSLVALFIARVIGIPSVLTIHGTMPPAGGRIVRGWLSWVKHRALRAATVVTVVSEATKLDLCWNPAIVIRNGIRVAGVRAAMRFEFRSARHLDDELVCVYAGRFSALKGMDLIFRAISAISRDDGLPVHLLMIGEGASVEVQYAERLAREAGIGNRISFLTRPREYPEVLAAGDVFLFPSRFEGLPIALLEAMAYGLAPVATSVGGVPEVIRDGIDGLLVPVGDYEAFLSALRRLLTDHLVRNKMALMAQQRIRQEFREDRMGEQYCEIYGTLAVGSGAIP